MVAAKITVTLGLVVIADKWMTGNNSGLVKQCNYINIGHVMFDKQQMRFLFTIGRGE